MPTWWWCRIRLAGAQSTPLHAGHGVNLRPARNRPPAARRRRRPAKRKEMLEVLSLIVSTVAYFIASHYIKRYLDAIRNQQGRAERQRAADCVWRRVRGRLGGKPR